MNDVALIRHLAAKCAIYCEADECCTKRYEAFKVGKARMDNVCADCQIEKAKDEINKGVKR